MDLNKAICKVAEAMLGHGEDGRNNHGFWIRIWRAGQKVYGSGAWCATSACWIVEQACYGAGMDKPLPVRRFGGGRSARKFAKRCEKFGRVVKQPMPGDVELRDRPGVGMHIEIVATVHPGGNRTNYAGNVGKPPAKYKLVQQPPWKFDKEHVKFIRLG